jgi:ABC-type multidrug transport system fused ATPase/permease subunit
MTAATEPPESKGLSLVWAFIRSRPKAYVAALALGVTASGLTMIQPLIVRSLIGNVERHSGSLLPPSLLLTALFLVATALSAGEEYILEAAGENMMHEVRTRVSGHLLRLPLATHHKFQAGDLISRVTADTTVLRNLVTTDAADTLIGILTMIGSIVFMATIDPILLLASMSTLVVGSLVVARLYPRARKASVRGQRSLGRVSAALDRSLRAIRTVKISRAEGRETARIEAESAAVRDAGLAMARFQSTVDPVVNLCVQGSLVIVLGFGAARVASGAIKLGDLIAFLMYLSRLIAPVVQFFQFLQQMQRGSAANLRLREVLDLPVEETGPPAAPTVGPVPGEVAGRRAVSVVFDDVSFGYGPASPVLEHVSVAIAPGSRVAVVGPSGAGKTTVLSLLSGFYFPDQGRVLIDGKDTAAIPLPQLRALIGLVEQDAPVLDGTIGENIEYAAPGSSSAAVTEAVRRSGLEARIERLDSGLDTQAGASGSMLSGGERQRVAIARSLLAAPRLLLLDEVTSQLDSLSERDMRDTIQAAASADCTVIVVAHRLSTVLDADRIIVLRDRTIEAYGSHSELMTGCAFYRSLVSAQFLDIGPDVDPISVSS